MPHDQRPPFEAAVFASPLFRLPPEIRTIFYKLLLVQEGGVAIPNDVFKQNKSTRDRNHPAGCETCCIFFSNQAEMDRHAEENRNREMMRRAEDFAIGYLTKNASILHTSTPFPIYQRWPPKSFTLAAYFFMKLYGSYTLITASVSAILPPLVLFATI